MEQRKCVVCGATWYPRRDKPPKRCPKCKSTRYNYGKYDKEARSKSIKESWKIRRTLVPTTAEPKEVKEDLVVSVVKK